MNAFERDITVLDYDPGQKGLRRPTGDVEAVREEVLAHLAEQRAEILSLPSDEAGLDIAGVRAFFEEAGLRVPAHVILNKETLPRFREVTDRMIAAQELIDGRGGMYHELLDIAAVFRDPAWEHRNGAVYTEGVLAHEFGHGSNEHRTLTCVQMPDLDFPVTWQARSGFTTTTPDMRKRRGELLEEIFAETKAADYRRATGAYEGRRQASGFAVPDEYITFKTTRTFRIGREALVAYMFELLTDIRPGLKPRMHEARQSIQGIVKFAKILNRLEPGFHNELRNMRGDDEGITRAARRMTEVYERNRPERPRAVILPPQSVS